MRQSALSAAIARAAAAPRLLVALDFDGTLAPLVDDPAEARALPAALEAVRALVALPRTSVAVVSGRALESLASVMPIPEEALVIGSHGAELRLGRSAPESLLDDEDRARRARLESVLSVVTGFGGTWIEHKHGGFAVHTRLAGEAETERARAAAREAVRAAGIPGLTEREGKDVLEFSVVSATKGEGLERLREHSGADTVVFVGDDVTDEDGFARLRPGDVGIKCGPGPTLAAHRVPDPAAVAEVISGLAAARRDVLARQRN